MALGNLAQGFAQGFGLVDSTKRQQEAIDYRRERDAVQDARHDRHEDRQERTFGAAMEDRAREQTEEALRRGIVSVADYIQQRGIQSPEQMTDQDRQRMQGFLEGPLQALQIRPDFLGTPAAERAVQVGDQFVNTGDMSLFADRENRRVAGEAAIGGFVAQGRDKPARGGKKRQQQEVYDITPVPGHPGMVAVQTLVTDENGESYLAPVTEGRDADPETDPNVRMLPMEGVMDRFLGFRALYHGLEEEGLMPMIRAAYAQAGGDPRQFDPPKVDHGLQEVKEGDQIKTYRTEDGRLVEPVAEAGRWQPQQPDKPTSGMREYEFARQQGFEGTFEDWKRQSGSGGGDRKGLTAGQRLRAVQEVAARELAATEYNDLFLMQDAPGAPLYFSGGRDADPERVRAANAKLQRATENALQQDAQGGLIDLAPREPAPAQGGGVDPGSYLNEGEQMRLMHGVDAIGGAGRRTGGLANAPGAPHWSDFTGP